MRVYEEGQRLPEPYKAALIELLCFQADSKFAGAQRIAENLRLAPRPEESYRLAQKASEEISHAWYCWSLLSELGIDVSSRMRHLIENAHDIDPEKVRVINAFKFENWTPFFEHWEDVAMFSTLVTPMATLFLGQYRESSYFPWRRVSERIWQEKRGQLSFGLWAARRVIQYDGDEGLLKLQAAVPKFLRMGLGFAGRPAAVSHSFERYSKMGLKLRKPEDLQCEYYELAKARLKDLDLYIPVDLQPDYKACAA